MSRLKAVPSVVQLPGGIKLQAIPFKVIKRDEAGRPIVFQIMPAGTPLGNDDEMWALFADEASIRAAKR